MHIEGLTSEQLQQYKKQFWNDVNNPDCVSYNLLTDKDVVEGEYEGKKLLLIRVPRATRSQRPVYCTSNPFRGHTYKRNNEGDYKCTNEEVRRMLADADDTHPQDSRILAYYSMTANWASPYVKELSRPNKVELTLPLVSLFPKDIHNVLNQVFGPNRINDLKQEALLALTTCLAEGSTNNDRLQHLLNMHPADITAMLRTLCTDGFLTSDGKGRGTTYQVNMQLTENVASSEANVASSEANVAISEANVANSETNVANSETNVARSETNVASYFKKKRLHYEEITELICSVATDYLLLEEIATAIGRNVRYLNNRIIPRMIEEQKLERLYPDIPNHPKQKYKAKKQ